MSAILVTSSRCPSAVQCVAAALLGSCSLRAADQTTDARVFLLVNKSHLPAGLAVEPCVQKDTSSFGVAPTAVVGGLSADGSVSSALP